MTGDAASGVIMSLNVKHETTFYFHVDFDGNVTGRGVIVYTLDPNLCGVAVLTRQVNEQVNFMKYLPVAFAAAAQLGRLAVTRFESTWATESTQITQKIDQFIETLPPKIEPAEGMTQVADFVATHPGIGKARNMAFADVDVSGFPKGRLWRPSGRGVYPDMPDVVPVPEETPAFKTGEWAQAFERDESQWNSTPKTRKAYSREFDSERMIMEYPGEEAAGRRLRHHPDLLQVSGLPAVRRRHRTVLLPLSEDHPPRDLRRVRVFRSRRSST